jgi:hypothetical protein
VRHLRVVVSPSNVVNYPQGGGHFWVYLQYLDGLRSHGADVWWLERFDPTGDEGEDCARIVALTERLRSYGVEDRLLLYTGEDEFVNVSIADAHRVFADADLLLNFDQRIGDWLLERFRLTALVDIDPGLLQYWMASGALTVARHDLYFTTGETVGKPHAKFPDCGLPWIQIRPPVSLDLWPVVPPPADGAFTTVSNWWGHEWVVDAEGVHDNTKRRAFLRFAKLPARTRAPLELALLLDPQTSAGRRDDEYLRARGWRVRHAHAVAGSPHGYQQYIRQSRGEFSCAKWSCSKFENAWISDRTLCYLATGRPAVVADTGRSELLPRDRGLFRFSTMDEAAAALEEIQTNYGVHAKAARELAELFDARRVAGTILSHSSTRAIVGSVS